PDALVVGLGLTDAAREPAAQDLLRAYQQRMARQDEAVEAVFGPEHKPHIHDVEPVTDTGPEPQLDLQGIAGFAQDLKGVIGELRESGVRSVLMTTVLLGNERDFPLNPVLSAYSKAIRQI